MTPIIFLRAAHRARDPFSAFLSIRPEDTRIHTVIIHERHQRPVCLYDLLDDQASEEFSVRHSETITVIVRRSGDVIATGIFEVYYRDGDLDLRPCVTVNLSLRIGTESPLSTPLQAYAGNLNASKVLVNEIAQVLQGMPKSNRSAKEEAQIEEVQA